MKDLLKSLEGLQWIAQLLLALFGVYGNLIRLLRSLIKGNVLNVILAVLAFITGGFGILLVVDLVCVILKKPIWWLD